ncbi:MAG TPA: hypothetical protein VHW09_23360 [Bryobacteraceae bacterium]|jgi:hypothetical protein|nr:hypothetical protein [Bryobacteraceae bacterium]
MKQAALLLVCLSVAWGQRPADADAAAMVEMSRAKALAYSQSLPDFVCTETIHRFTHAPARALMPWVPSDTLAVRLSYFQQQEEHKLVLLNDKPTDRKYESLAGGIGTGEFGGTLHGIFDPSTSTAFHWVAWKSVRRHRVAVFAYEVDAAHSRYEVLTGAPGAFHAAIVAFHGEIDIDRETGEVLHFTYITGDIPIDVGLDQASTTVDYDFADVGGRNYLLPSRCETEMHSRKLSVRNDIDFREYRKFSADSSIEFGAGK